MPGGGETDGKKRQQRTHPARGTLQKLAAFYEGTGTDWRRAMLLFEIRSASFFCFVCPRWGGVERAAMITQFNRGTA